MSSEISCYPHFCNSNGICVYDTCVCNVGFTGKACDTVIIITSEVSSTPTDPTTGVSDLCEKIFITLILFYKSVVHIACQSCLLQSSLKILH